MGRTTLKAIRRFVIAAVVLISGLAFVPVLTVFYLATGLIDVLRNKRRDELVFRRYFLGNGTTTWLLSPCNLFVDLLCDRNKGVYRQGDLPEAWRAELDSVLDVFCNNKDALIADVDRAFEQGPRGMFVYECYGKKKAHDVEGLKRDLRYVKTIAVSVFSGK